MAPSAGHQLRRERKKFVPYSVNASTERAAIKNVPEKLKNSSKEITQFSRYNTSQLTVGALGWGKLKGSSWWPAILIDSSSCGLTRPTTDNIYVFWVGDNTVSEIPKEMFVKFAENFEIVYNSLSKSGKKLSLGIVLSIKYHAQHIGHNIQNLDDTSILTWAKTGFHMNKKKIMPPLRGMLPSEVQEKLNDILKRNISKTRHTSDDTSGENQKMKLKVDKKQQSHQLRQERKKFVPYSVNASTERAAIKNVPEKLKNSSKEITQFSRYNTSQLTVGALGWGKLKGSSWWPAILIDSSSCGLTRPTTDNIYVFWVGDNTVSEIPCLMFVKFAENFDIVYNSLSKHKSKKLSLGIVLSIKYHAEHIGYNIQNLDDTSILTWAETGFHINEKKIVPPLIGILPSEVQAKLNDILERNISKTRHTSDDTRCENLKDKLKPDEEQRMVLNKCKNSELTFMDLCICCLSQDGILSEHPIFEASICEKCIKRMKKYLNFHENGSKVACSVCFNKGGYWNCKNSVCNATICEVCVISFDIHSDLGCPLCQDLKKYGIFILRPHHDILQRILNLYTPTIYFQGCKNSIRVLSLFDGIGSGYFVLNKLGLSISKYYASEIDKEAIEISMRHGGSEIVHLGDVTEISEVKLLEILSEGPIDLLIGGSPCNDLSLANPNRKGPYDFSGTGPLFFEYNRILSALKKLQPDYHLFWMFENVANMPNAYKETISGHLGMKPVSIDATHFSPQKRDRYFWGNIPGLGFTALPSKSPVLNDYLHGERKATVDKLRTITTTAHSLRQGKNLLKPVSVGESFSDLWPTEIEAIFGFPAHYTDVANITPRKRIKLLGKSWSIQVVEYILSSLNLFFNCDHKDLSEI